MKKTIDRRTQSTEKTTKPSRPERFQNFINGKWKDARGGRTFTNLNPADITDVIGEFPSSGAEDVQEAVEAAKKAFIKWRLFPAPHRGEIIYRAAEKLREKKSEIAREMTREMGKILKEAEGDTQEGIDCGYHHAGEGRRLFGFTTPSEMKDKTCFTIRQPVGVCGLISPWNFPLAIPTWKMFPALVAGNTVVFKPASDVPKTATSLVRILEECGIPPGVVNLVHGSGTSVGMPIVRHPDVRVISFTGSSDIGREIGAIAGGMLKRISCELGGKNGQIVMDDADLDLAVEGALFGAFGTTGQRCTATSRLILHEKIKDRFVDKLLMRTRRLKLGNGLDPKTDVGPVVNRSRIESIHGYVKIARREGAKILCGGEPATEGNLRKGFFYRPTILDGVKPAMRVAREEIFGPVVSLLTISSFDEAMRVLNDTEYGLSGSIYTRDVNRAFASMRDFETGIVYINAPTIGAESHLPFGGWKSTGNGHREGAHTIYDVFTEWKTAFIDHSGRLQKAQIDAVEVD